MEEADPVERAAQYMRAAVASMHRDSAREPIRWPDSGGAFPADILLRPPPVVVDANILRNDVLRSCRTGQRTVLVTAANAGLFRLFSAEHVYQEVIEHSGDWAASGPVTRERFLQVWLADYLPLLRIVKISEGQLAWLDPDELSRVQELAAQDPDDVPSATLALLIRAFFLSNDRKALRAVYGDADLSEHQRWVDLLKAGGDAGELEKNFTMALNLAMLAGHGLISGTRRVLDATSPWVVIPVAALLVGLYFRAPGRAKQGINAGVRSALSAIAGAAVAYDEVRQRFNRAAPKVPGWESLADTNPPGAVLGRACIHTLARCAQGERSAEELAEDLPYLNVAHGEAKVREVLRATSSFTEVWRGRWQVGYAAPPVLRYLKVKRDAPRS
jgi:predicted nucleic acid-binding protein